MKNKNKLIETINNDKEISKKFGLSQFYSAERFIDDAKRYIKAINDRRMINSIGSVSNSGMSRTIKFLSCDKNRNTKEFYYSNYYGLFEALGFTPVKNDNYFRISGCGMDMIFHTNYTIIRELKRLGFISKKQCSKLEQMTPQTI